MSDVVVVQVTEQSVVNVEVTPTTVVQSNVPGVVSVVAPVVNTGSSTSAIIGLDMAYLGSYDTTNQTVASVSTAYKLAIGTSYMSNHITLANSRMTFQRGGVYNQTFSIQFTNSGNADFDVAVWTRVNGVDAPYTASIVTVPPKHGNVSGKTVAQVSFIGRFVANDYIEIWWHADSTTVGIETIGAGTNPVTPVSPGVISLLQQIG